MSAFKRKREDGSTHWHYRKQVTLPDGSKKRISGAPDINTKAAALDAERAHIERVLNPPAEKPPEVPTFEAFADVFMKNHASKYKASELYGKRQILKQHLIPRFGPMRLDEIGRLDTDGFRAELLERGGCGDKRINNILAVLSRILRYAKEVKLISEKPTVGMAKIEADEQPYDFLEFAEYEALVEAARGEPMWLAAILLAGDAGLRRGEVMALRWEHLDNRNHQIVVQQNVWNGVIGLPKGGKKRTVPMTTRLRAALKRARTLSPTVIVGPEGDYATVEQMRWNLPRLHRAAEVREVARPWHCLRHTFCSHLVMRGASVKAIQEVAGHKDLKTTLRYMHLAPGETARAIALLETPWHDGGTATGDQEGTTRKRPATS